MILSSAAEVSTGGCQIGGFIIGSPPDADVVNPDYVTTLEGILDRRSSQSGHPISPLNPISPIGDEIAALNEIKSALLLPLSSKGETLGIISLGPRLGDLPYSIEDEQLLMSVAGPATL